MNQVFVPQWRRAKSAAFDLERNRCYRRELGYFSEHGEIVAPRRSLPVVENVTRS